MSETRYLKRLFQAYYKENKSEIPIVSLINQREFGFIPWDRNIIMKRHMSFKNHESITNYLAGEGPRHVYSSGALYLQPDNTNMENKEYQGCDLIIDIDVDHFYTPCKEDHDLWYCKECGKSGKGMSTKCPKCGKLKLKSLTWICEDCLSVAKNEIIKLIYNFLIPDFGVDIQDIKIAFSGHRGYHLRIEKDEIRSLTSNERREISDYFTGENISFELLGLQEKGGNIFGISKMAFGWSQKITKRIEEFLLQAKDIIEKQLMDERIFNFNKNLVKSFLNYKDDLLNTIRSENRNIWTIEGFGLSSWNKFLKVIVDYLGVEVDVPVTVDIHRLIRYPGSLHGKTGFKVQEIYIDELDKFNPLDEANKKLDPIKFKGEKEFFQKIKIIEPEVPVTKIKGESWGPYKQGDIVEVPHHIAVFLLCKGVAKTV
jgi:DNA primase small subunit